MGKSKVDDISYIDVILEHPFAGALQQNALDGEWKMRASQMTAANLKAIEIPLAELDAHLTLRSHVVGYSLSRADLYMWGSLRGNKVAASVIKQGLMINISRWYTFIEESNPWITEVVLSESTAAMSIKSDSQDKGASYDIGLQDTSKGVITRFPPEPSGYLHIGHAKAALLNDYFAHQKYHGTLILRFDDTNPMKEKQEFEDSIIEDLALLGISPDKTTHTSDYFQELHDYCVQMLKEGTAYADDTPQEVLRAERMEGIPSKHRNAKPDENLTRFQEMQSGTEEGKVWFIRAKISMADHNKAMRDPVIYRCSPQPHHRTGDRWKVYPTYDFCCPIVDSIEGVTHALRTTEYNDRDAQYQWMLKALKLRGVYNWNFSRLNMVRTLLSKRKLTKFVNEGVVAGWDDPRMPTVRGIRRHGMTVPALQEFILKQGPSKNIVLQDWAAFWATNKKYIDPVAARYVAITKANAVPVTVIGARAAPYTEEVVKHVKYSLGTKKVVYSGSILMEQEDAQSFELDEEITLMNWGNAIVRKISHSMLGLSKTVSGLELELHLQGDVKKTKKKVTWLSTDQELVPVEICDFDHLITKDKLEENDDVENFLNPNSESKVAAIADCNVAQLLENDIMQFDRKGYFRVDRPFLHGEPAIFFQIPTGKGK